MSNARIQTPAEGWNQQSGRAVGLFFDQHKSAVYPYGRPWWAWTETPADPTHARGCVGEVSPVNADMKLPDGTIVKGWSAPWVPEQKYIVMALSLLSGNRFKIDYSRQITDYRAANERYYRLAASTAGAKNWQAPKMYGPVEFQLRAIVGDAPKSPKVPEAALAEDPWLLGFSTQENEKVGAILAREQHRDTPLEYQEAITGEESNPLASLSSDEMSELLEMIRQNKQAKVMRAAKKTHSSAEAA